MSYAVSVIIPAYNAEKYIKECVESIVSSSVFNLLEVLLIDDGSRDGTAQICDDYAGKYKNINVFHIENGGVSNARNIGIEAAQGKYVTFCDADDYYINDILSSAIKVLENNDSDLLFYDYLYETQNKTGKMKYEFDSEVFIESNDIIFRHMIINDNFNSACNKFFKRKIIQENNLAFRVGQKHGEDRDFVIVFLSVAESAYYLPVEGYFYRYVKTSAVNSSRTDYFDNIFYEAEYKQTMSEKFNLSREDVKRRIGIMIINRVITNVFTASENSLKAYLKAMKSLTSNEKLMEVVRNNKDAVLYNFAHEKVLECIKKEQIIRSFLFIRYQALKEKISQLIFR